MVNAIGDVTLDASYVGLNDMRYLPDWLQPM